MPSRPRCCQSDSSVARVGAMNRRSGVRGNGTVLLAVGVSLLSALCLAQQEAVLPKPDAAATGTAEVTAPPQQPRDNTKQPATRTPETVTLPTVDLERSRLQPGANSRALVGGQWISPQWVLGASARLPTHDVDAPQTPQRAPAQFQPTSAPPERAVGLDEKITPPMVARYQNATVVRFVAPRESITNLLEELSLDDLNRYQFRRNRPEAVPVEQP